MKITYLGHSCFKVETASISLLFDPFADIGYDVKQTSADVVLCSHDHFDHNAAHRIKSNRIISDIVNEEIDGVKIETLLSYHDEVKGAKRGINRIYKITSDDKTLVHLGDLGDFDNNVSDFIGHADVLLIPVGGTYTIDANQAKDVIYITEPKSVIPMHYKSVDSRINIAPLHDFTSLFSKISYLPSSVDTASLKDGINVMEIEK